MATTQDTRPFEEAGVKAESPDQNRPETEKLKRKVDLDHDSTDGGSPKRARHERTGNDRRGRSPSPYSLKRRPSMDNRRPSIENRRLSYDEPARRPSATAEDKKRGKRLFGGLLSTLSQTNTNSQQKRRQEIEKRQYERIQKQKAEDDQKREDKLARLNYIRMAEQMDFERKVVRDKHAKMMGAAQHLKTKAQPSIYYRPWKLTREQEDIIQDQIADAKEAVERDGEAFRIRERKHREQYRRLTPPPKSDVAEGSSDVKGSDENTTVKVADAGRPSTKVEKDHDDSNEVIVMDEDTVIY